MKKFVSLLLVLCIVGLTGCGAPAGVNKDDYDSAIKALDAVDDYIDGKQDRETALAAVSQMHDKVEENNVSDTEQTKHLSITVDLFSLQAALELESRTIIDVKNARESLAETIGK